MSDGIGAPAPQALTAISLVTQRRPVACAWEWQKSCSFAMSAGKHHPNDRGTVGHHRRMRLESTAAFLKARRILRMLRDDLEA